MLNVNLMKSALPISVVTAVACFMPQRAQADCAIAQTLFRDSLYGVAGGIIVSGLYMLAQNDVSNAPSKLGYGGLTGLAIGAGVGVVEVALDKDCTGGTEKKEVEIETQSSLFPYSNKNKVVFRGRIPFPAAF